MAREKISTTLCVEDIEQQAWAAAYGTSDPCSNQLAGYGDTALEAAMRAFLESRCKDKDGFVQVPTDFYERIEHAA